MEIIPEMEVVQQGSSAVVELRWTLIRVHWIVELISFYGEDNIFNFFAQSLNSLTNFRYSDQK